jgi:sulfate transport system permease protein
MAGISTTQFSKYSAKVAQNRATSEPAWVRWALIFITLLFLSLFLFMPLASCLYRSTKKRLRHLYQALVDADALSAVKLTVIASLIAVPLNLVFGILQPGLLRNLSSKAKAF